MAVVKQVKSFIFILSCYFGHLLYYAEEYNFRLLFYFINLFGCCPGKPGLGKSF